MTKQRAPSHNFDDPPTRSNAEKSYANKILWLSESQNLSIRQFWPIWGEKNWDCESTPGWSKIPTLAADFLDSDQAKKIGWLIAAFCFVASPQRQHVTAAHVTDVPDKAEQVTQYNTYKSNIQVTENTNHDMTEKRHKEGI